MNVPPNACRYAGSLERRTGYIDEPARSVTAGVIERFPTSRARNRVGKERGPVPGADCAVSATARCLRQQARVRRRSVSPPADHAVAI